MFTLQLLHRPNYWPKVFLLLICLVMIYAEKEAIAIEPLTGEAFICDLDPDVEVKMYRNEKVMLMKKSKALGTQLHIGDRIVLYSGWADICTLYSGKQHRLGTVKAGSPPVSFEIQKDSLPTPYSRLQAMLIDLYTILQPSPKSVSKELITKGGQQEVMRDSVFPPKDCKASIMDHLAVAWNVDLVDPVMVLRWDNDKERLKDLVDYDGHYRFPYAIEELLKKRGTTIKPGESIKMTWTLKDSQTQIEVTGIIEVTNPTHSAASGKDIQGEMDVFNSELNKLAPIITLVQQDYCLAARTNLDNLTLDHETQLLQKLRYRTGYYEKNVGN